MSLEVAIVEDYPIVRRQLARFLTAQGHTVHNFERGEDLLQAHYGNLDIIFMDTDLGRGNKKGYHICSELRELGYERPIIGYSGSPIPPTDQWQEAGVTHFEARTLNRQDLSDYLEQYQ